MSRNPEKDQNWPARIDAYLDGRLSRDDARLVLDTIVQESAVRRMFTLALLQRSHDGPVSDPDPGLPEACQRACDLIDGYVAGEIDGSDIAFLSRHLETCANCDEEYRSLRDADEKTDSEAVEDDDLIDPGTLTRFRDLLDEVKDSATASDSGHPPKAGLPQWLVYAIPGAAIAIVCASLLFDQGGAGAARTHDGLILPIPPQTISDLLLAASRPDNESDPITEAMALCRHADPDCDRKIAGDPLVRGALDRIDLGGVSGADQDRVRFLLAVLHDPRFTPGEQGRALDPLRRVLGDRGREYFWQLAEGTAQNAIFGDALGAVGLLRFRPEEKDRLRPLFDRAMALRFDAHVGYLLEKLGILDHPDTPDLCLRVLVGRCGAFPGTFPPAARILIAYARKKASPELRAMVEQVAMSGPFPLGRLAALRSLWTDDRSSRWDSQILEFADHDDVRLRRLVADHLREARNPEHIPVIEAMIADPDLGVKKSAKSALDRLSGQVPERKRR